MKKSEIAIAAALICIIALILVVLFFGFRVLNFGQPNYPYDAQSPSANATLWEKAEWAKYHGSHQCGYFAETLRPVIIVPLTNTTISKILICFALTPGESPHDITNITYTLSTKDAMRTVRYNDPSVNLTYGYWNGLNESIQSIPRDYLLEKNEIIYVELDAEKMGFTSSTFGLNQRFVLAVTPPEDCFRGLEIRGTTPAEFLPGIPIENPRWR